MWISSTHIHLHVYCWFLSMQKKKSCWERRVLAGIGLMAVQKLSKQASCLCTAPAVHLAASSKCSAESSFLLEALWPCPEPDLSPLRDPNLGLTERLPSAPCPRPAVLPATVVLNCKRRSLNRLHSWPGVSFPVPLFASHSPPCWDLPAYSQPPPPIPWPLPSPGWVFSSRSQTNLKSFSRLWLHLERAMFRWL